MFIVAEGPFGPQASVVSVVSAETKTFYRGHGGRQKTEDVKIPTLLRKKRERRVGHPRAIGSGGIRCGAWLGNCRRPRCRRLPALQPTSSGLGSRTGVRRGLV